MSCICEFLAPLNDEPIPAEDDTELTDDKQNEHAQPNESGITIAPVEVVPAKHSLVNAGTLSNLKAEIKELRKTLTDTHLSIENREAAIKAAITKQYALQQELDDVRLQQEALEREYQMQLDFTRSEEQQLESELLACQEMFENREQLCADLEQCNASLVKELIAANDKIEQLALKYCGLKVQAVELSEQMDCIEHMQLEDDFDD